MKLSLLILATTLLAAHTFAEAAGHAHVHGVAKLDVAVESTKVSIQLDSPLDNLIGFERAPKTDAERQLVDRAVATLKAADTMFRIDPAAQCKLSHVELSSAALHLGTPSAGEAAEGHADIDGSFEFDCVDARKAAYIEVGLFQFARVQGLEIQVASPQGEFRRDLKRPASRISLVK
jgi:hypothetical protein